MIQDALCVMSAKIAATLQKHLTVVHVCSSCHLQRQIHHPSWDSDLSMRILVKASLLSCMRGMYRRMTHLQHVQLLLNASTV